MRIIAHIDMDAFFAAIEERENPQFQGLGIVVGADPKEGMGRGVVSTANYQARKYGIHSALPISKAWQYAQAARKRGAPKTVFLPVNGSYYSEVSDRIFDIIRKYVPRIEKTSVDEAYLDLSSIIKMGDTSEGSQVQAPPEYTLKQNLGNLPRRQAGVSGRTHKLILKQDELELICRYQKAAECIQKIREEIRQKERLTAKVAIAPNKLVAKIATSKSKPDTVSIIYPQDVQNFLDPLGVRDIPGVGPKTEEVLHGRRMYTIGQLRSVSEQQLVVWLGKWGSDLYRKVRGVDDSAVSEDRQLKSISEQETFEIDTRSSGEILERFDQLAKRVIERMVHDQVSGYKTVTMSIRFSDFTTKTKAHTLPDFANDYVTLKNEGMKLLFPFLDSRSNPQKKAVRLIGIGIEGFPSSELSQRVKESVIQESLF